MALNREYKPLGFNNSTVIYEYSDYPVFTEYKKVTESRLIKLSWGGESGIVRDSDGKIAMVFLYNDATNPASCQNKKEWDSYMEKIKLLSRFEIAKESWK